MTRYLLSRLGLFVLTLWAAVTVNFIVPRLMPGSPAEAAIAKLARNQTVTPEMQKAIVAQLGVPNGNLWDQYVTYLGQVAHLDFGVSYSNFPHSVRDMVLAALPWTVVLVGLVTIISYAVGTLLGIFGAWRRGRALDTWATVGGQFFAAFPPFWFGMLVLFFLGYVGRVFPTSGSHSPDIDVAFSWASVTDIASHAMLPALTIFATTVGTWVLTMRNTMIGTLGDDYVTFAEANGLKPRTIALRYAARNALLPNLTQFGLVLGGVIGGSLLVETVFGYPGLGLLLFNAVSNQDFPLMQALFLMITVAFLVANLAVDLLYGLLDPRTRS
ncbi:ABC transporter permease [Leifsonia poae]|uniref:ABC transporter permease n=1 Tax=Leifsonia poae TaxID=110933 RepID=UPI003D67E331